MLAVFSCGQTISEVSYLVHWLSPRQFASLDFKIFGLSESPGQVTSQLDGVNAVCSRPIALGF